MVERQPSFVRVTFRSREANYPTFGIVGRCFRSRWQRLSFFSLVFFFTAPEQMHSDRLKHLFAWVHHFRLDLRNSCHIRAAASSLSLRANCHSFRTKFYPKKCRESLQYFRYISLIKFRRLLAIRPSHIHVFRETINITTASASSKKYSGVASLSNEKRKKPRHEVVTEE